MPLVQQSSLINSLRDNDVISSIEHGQSCHRIIKGNVSSKTNLQEFDNKKISQYKFNQMARENRDVFCFYRVMKGNDRDTFLMYLLDMVNTTNFERHNLATGGISLEGWLYVIKLCENELKYKYRLFEKKGENLFYITAFGKGDTVDIVLIGDHMERAKVVGRYPTTTIRHLNRIVYGNPMFDTPSHTLVNSQNAHFSNPGFSSKVGAASGCGGSVTSADALKQDGMYSVMKVGGKKQCPKTCKCNCHRCNCKSHCGKKCECLCHKKCPGNCGCRCHRCMSCGKTHRKGGKKCPMSGGNGYGFSMNQSLASTSGVNAVNGSVHLGQFSKYENTGINADTNMGASSQSGGSGYGENGIPFYAYVPKEGENLSTFAGSGYPPISRELNPQCITPPVLVQGGGKKRTHKKKHVRKSTKKNKPSKKVHKKGKKSMKRKNYKKQKGGYSQYMSNVANSHNYSTGAPPSLSYTESALATPPPFTPKNDCLNTWKHLGDTPPYNEVYM